MADPKDIKPKPVRITTEYITLGQFLKLTDYVQGGGEAKEVLAFGGFIVNGEEDNRRGRKLYPGDEVTFPNHRRYRVESRSGERPAGD